MAKAYFLPHDEAGKRKWLKNFAGKMSAYAATVGVTPAGNETVTGVLCDVVVVP